VALCIRVAVAKDADLVADLVADVRSAETSHAQSRGDPVREGDRREVANAGLEVESGHDRVEEGLIHDVVDVPVDVLVGPPRRDPAQHAEVLAGRQGLGVAHAGSASRIRWLMTADTPSPRMDTP